MAYTRLPTTPRARPPTLATAAIPPFFNLSLPRPPPPHYNTHGQLTPRTRRLSDLMQQQLASHPSHLPIHPEVAQDLANFISRVPPSAVTCDYDHADRTAIYHQLLLAVHAPYNPPYPLLTPTQIFQLALDAHTACVHRLLAELPPPPMPVAKVDYSAYFRPDGSPDVTLIRNEFGKAVLPHSRGIFMRHLPAGTTLADITAHIRGGALERVDWHQRAAKAFVGAYFILAADAAAFIRSVRCKRFWGDVTVEAITHAKGGHEVMKVNVGRAVVEEGATRVLVVEGLPEWLDAEALVGLVRQQSSTLEIEVESVWVEGGWARLVMASIGTALGARLMCAGTRELGDLRFSFERDPCEGGMRELGEGIFRRD